MNGVEDGSGGAVPWAAAVLSTEEWERWVRAISESREEWLERELLQERRLRWLFEARENVDRMMLTPLTAPALDWLWEAS